jgi:Ni/Co efflux regulator RcnB
MKKSIIIFLLLASFFLTANAQSQPSGVNQEGGKYHRGHDSHSKRGGHHRGIRLFHRHHHHNKDHDRSNGHSHHSKKGHGGKGH